MPVTVVFYLIFVSSLMEPGGKKTRNSLGSWEYDDSEFNVKVNA